MTNFEKVKNMTVEEIVELICEGACNYCVYADNCKGFKCCEGVKAWLEQETENEIKRV